MMLSIMISLFLSLIFSYLIYANLLIFTFIYFIISFLMMCMSVYLLSHSGWGIALMAIVIISGLMVVFFIMISANPELPEMTMKIPKILLIMLSLMVLFEVHFPSLSNVQEVLSFNYNCLSLNYFNMSFAIILFLVILIVTYIRLTYSKGGGLRKKYYWL